VAEDRIRMDGAALEAQVTRAWSQLMEDIRTATDKEQLVTIIAKHVRDSAVRDDLILTIRVLWMRRLSREKAALLLEEFYVDFVKAVANRFDDLSPVVSTSLQGAGNSQVISFPTENVLNVIYGKAG
jgi:hypothetical protein